MDFVILIAIFFLVRAAVVEAYMVPSSSMENSLLIGDFLLADKYTYGGEIPLTGWDLPGLREPRAGDIVVFKFPGDGVTKYIKRCVAVGGDTVRIIDKQLFVNGKRFCDAPGTRFIDTTSGGDQHIIPAQGHDSRDNFGPFVVPPDSYFMMGDNRDNSYDSRYWGPVARDLVVARARLVHFSWNDSIAPGPDITLRDPLSVPRAFLHGARHVFEKVRWDRLLTSL